MPRCVMPHYTMSPFIDLSFMGHITSVQRSSNELQDIFKMRGRSRVAAHSTVTANPVSTIDGGHIECVST